MSFPPNLGITNALIIDSDYCLILHELPSILSPLKQISSPFSKMNNNGGYSRISTTKRSKSIDFADLSSHHHKPRNSRFNPREIAEPNGITMTTVSEESCPGEVFGNILSRKRAVPTDRAAIDDRDVGKGSFTGRRSASVYESYSRMDHQLDDDDDDDDDQCEKVFITNKKCVKKKGKLFGAFKRLFGL